MQIDLNVRLCDVDSPTMSYEEQKEWYSQFFVAINEAVGAANTPWLLDCVHDEHHHDMEFKFFKPKQAKASMSISLRGYGGIGVLYSPFNGKSGYRGEPMYTWLTEATDRTISAANYIAQIVAAAKIVSDAVAVKEPCQPISKPKKAKSTKKDLIPYSFTEPPVAVSGHTYIAPQGIKKASILSAVDFDGFAYKPLVGPNNHGEIWYLITGFVAASSQSWSGFKFDILFDGVDKFLPASPNLKIEHAGTASINFRCLSISRKDPAFTTVDRDILIDLVQRYLASLA